MQATQIDQTSTTDQGIDKTSGVPAQTGFAAVMKLRIPALADWQDPLTFSNDVSGTHRYHGFEADAAGKFYHHTNAVAGPTYVPQNMWTDSYTGTTWVALTVDGTTQNAYHMRPRGAFTTAPSIALSISFTPARLSIGRQPLFGTTDVNGLIELECILIYNVALPPGGRGGVRSIMEADSRRPVRWQNLIFWNDCTDPKKLHIDMSGKGGNWALTGTPGQVRSPGASRFRLHSSGLWVLRTQAGGSAFTGDVNETVTVSESAAAQMATSAGPSETVTLSEALAASQGMVPSGLDENVPLNETADGIRGHVVGINETVSGPTESLVAQYSANPGPNETVNLSEQVVVQMAASPGVNETVGLSESAAASAGSPIGLNETVGLSEALAAIYGAVVGVNETVPLSEALAVVQGMLAGLNESVTLAEALVVVYGAVVGLSETDNLSESIDVQGGGGFVDLSETVPFSESVAVSAGYKSPINETVALSESLAAAKGALAALSESLGALGESLAAAYAAIVALSETVPNGESVSATGTGAAADVNETVAWSEAMTASLAAFGALAETMTLAEALATRYDGHLPLSETVGWNETLTVLTKQLPATLKAILQEVGGWRAILRE